MMHKYGFAALVIMSVMAIVSCSDSSESNKAASSSYNQDIRKATTSRGLSKSDLAWHAQNTYGWDCSQVISKDKMTSGGYFMINCSNGKQFRVYPRAGQHPKITNARGGWD